MSRLMRDESGILVGWLVRLVLGFAVVAVILFDVGSIFVNFFNLDSTANEIAVAVALDADPRRTLPQQPALEVKARELASAADARLVSVTLEDRTVIVILRRRADTLIVDRIGPIRDWALATADGRSATK